MFATLVMTVMGPDRPGLVRTVAARVADHGGNWLESRMCHLGGQFAGILRVEVDVAQRNGLIKALRTLEADGLRVIVDSGEEAAEVSPGGLRAAVEIVGQDRAGILRALSSVFATHGVNVEELASDRTSVPMGGGTLFQARATVLLPENVTLAALRAELERIAADLMVDVRLDPAAPTDAGRY